jgi:selenocysteine lyase/cysteine desulfurase
MGTSTSTGIPARIGTPADASDVRPGPLAPPELGELAAHRAALDAFRRDYPDFDAAGVEALRTREYARLDVQDHVYLDYTGGSLYAESQLRAHHDLLRREVFGNPHSANPTSCFATAMAEEARAAVLRFCNAAPDDYVCVFTPNASGALKLLGEAYPFAPGPGPSLLLTADNHNSVNGIREFARARGAGFAYLPVAPPDLRVPADRLVAHLEAAPPGAPRLFAYPAQSNLSGVQHPLEWIEEARGRGWDVLLDAAAFAPTNQLDLHRWRPDFVALSFYKLFGYPTGVGCLLARREALARLRRPWFAGGTIVVSSVGGDGHLLAPGEAAFEDGTIDYLGLPAVTIGLRHLEALGMDTIHARVRCLTGWLLGELAALRHRTGAPLVRLYGPAGTARRGATVAFNLLAPDGSVVDCTLVEARANRRRISLRTGCFCNPGASEAALGLTREELAPIFRPVTNAAEERDRRLLAERRKAAGAVRVSLGIATTFADLYRFVRFVKGFLDAPQPHVPAD